MSVIGIGNDIVEIARIAQMSAASKEKLAKRVLTDNELQQYRVIKNQDAFLAKRWAGKEAAAKALGTGIADGVSFQHFDIVNLKSGQPTLILSERALAIAHSKGATQWHISLSDEQHYATAFVVLAKE